MMIQTAKLRPLVFGILATLSVGGEAKDFAETTGLLDWATDGADVQPFEEWGVKWGGWINTGISTNFNNSKWNGPVTFGDLR
ncbi:MAG: hypothetical protein AB1648_00210 [Pseudomonadota bacterium]